MRLVKVLLAVFMMTVIVTGTASAQEVTGKIGLTPQLGLVMPTGDFGDTYVELPATAGFAGGFSVEYFLNENIAFGGKFMYDRFGMDTETAEEEYPTIDWDGNWTIIEFGAFVKYTFTPNSPTRFFGRVGFIMGKVDGKLEGSQGGVSADAEIDISSALGLEGGIGVMHLINETTGIFGEIGLTHLMTDGKDAEIGVPGASSMVAEMDMNTQWLAIRGGVTFLVGGN